MSEHEHKYELDVKGNFYYCECGESDLTIRSLMAEREACIEYQPHIKALEGVVGAAKALFIFIDDNVIWGKDYENTNPSAVINNSVELGYKFDTLRGALSKLEEV